MNISYNWLKKYIAADLSAEAMATILTDIGLEVESFGRSRLCAAACKVSSWAKCSPARSIPIRIICT